MRALFSALDFRSLLSTHLSGKVSESRPENSDDGIKSSLLVGMVVTLVLFVGVGYWGATTSIAGAVIASGTVVVESSVKKVQHQTGGIVRSILARDGDHVRAGDVVLQLDDTLTSANLQIISEQLDRVAARKARLDAERLGRSKMRIPPSLQARMQDSETAAVVASERAVFESRANALVGQKAQLKSRVQQLGQQIEGLRAQQAGVRESLALLLHDSVDVEALFEKKLISKDRVSAIRLDVSKTRGEDGRLTAAIAEVEAKVSETGLQILQLDEQMRSEVTNDLRETESKQAELSERKLLAQDDLAKTTVRAGQSGSIQESSVHTVGGVIGAGEVAMVIVPDTDSLVVDALVPPASVDDVHPGQPVSIRFSAFDTGTTPMCHGRVNRLSADLIKDSARQLSYFLARIDIDKDEECLVSLKSLRPGMPAEVHISTGERNVWSYVMKPLADQMSRAFRQ